MEKHICSVRESQVLATRAIMGGLVIRRRRECGICRKLFSTYEIPVTLLTYNQAGAFSLIGKMMRQAEKEIPVQALYN